MAKVWIGAVALGVCLFGAQVLAQAPAPPPAAAPSASPEALAAYQQAITTTRAKAVAFAAALPRGARLATARGKPGVTLPDGSTRDLTAAEQAAFDAFFAAMQAEERAKLDVANAELLPEEKDAMAKARTNITTVLGPGLPLRRRTAAVGRFARPMESRVRPTRTRRRRSPNGTQPSKKLVPG